MTKQNRFANIRLPDYSCRLNRFCAGSYRQLQEPLAELALRRFFDACPMQLSTNQIQKIQEIEQKLAEYRKLYNDWPARRKIILLQVGLLKNAYYKITGQEYQKQKDLRNSISKA